MIRCMMVLFCAFRMRYLVEVRGTYLGVDVCMYVQGLGGK